MPIENKHSRILRMPRAGIRFISQTDLAECELRRPKAVAAAAALQAKRRVIREALQSGAEIEPGLRRVQMRSVTRLTIG